MPSCEVEEKLVISLLLSTSSPVGRKSKQRKEGRTLP